MIAAFFFLHTAGLHFYIGLGIVVYFAINIKALSFFLHVCLKTLSSYGGNNSMSFGSKPIR